jgi:hypothetical protein
MAAPKLTTYFQSYTTDNLGQIFLTGILNIEEYNSINVEIVQWPQANVNMTVNVYIGKNSGNTLAQLVAEFPLGIAYQIHTFQVIGPEFNLILTGGPANTDIGIQAWVFLH